MGLNGKKKNDGSSWVGVIFKKKTAMRKRKDIHKKRGRRGEKHGRKEKKP